MITFTKHRLLEYVTCFIIHIRASVWHYIHKNGKLGMAGYGILNLYLGHRAFAYHEKLWLDTSGGGTFLSAFMSRRSTYLWDFMLLIDTLNMVWCSAVIYLFWRDPKINIKISDYWCQLSCFVEFVPQCKRQKDSNLYHNSKYTKCTKIGNADLSKRSVLS